MDQIISPEDYQQQHADKCFGKAYLHCRLLMVSPVRQCILAIEDSFKNLFNKEVQMNMRTIMDIRIHDMDRCPNFVHYLSSPELCDGLQVFGQIGWLTRATTGRVGPRADA